MYNEIYELRLQPPGKREDAYNNGISEQVLESISEAPHEIAVNLYWSPSFQDRKTITSQREILVIPVSILVGVH